MADCLTLMHLSGINQAFGTKSKNIYLILLAVNSWLWNTANKTVMNGLSASADYENKAYLYLVNQWQIFPV